MAWMARRNVPQNKPVQPILIQSRWGGRCSECQCKIEPGDTVQYIPAPKSKQAQFQSGSRLEMKGKIQHPAGQCGSEYTVHAVYACTRKQVKVRCYSADQAVAEVAGKLDKPAAGKAIPMSYEVWQGNVRVR